MSVHEVDDVRAALDGLADSIEIPNMLPLSGIAPMANRRSRRQQIVGGLATVLLVVMVTVGVGLVRQDNTPSAVFAGQNGELLVPVTATNDGDQFVGLAILDPFELDDEGNNQLILVTSSDAQQWERAEDAPVITGTGQILGKRDDVFHMVGMRGVEVVALDGTTSIETELVHSTSTDLVSWTETVHPLPEETETGEVDRRTLLDGMAFVESGPVVLLSHHVSFSNVEDELEALGVERSDVCDFAGQGTISRVRPCGEIEPIEFAIAAFSSPFIGNELALLHDETVEFTDVPMVDDGRPSTPVPSRATIYQTDDGIGVSARDVFESTDGVRWEQVELGREPAAMMAVRGSERVFKSSVHVERYRTDDPVTGMGYSSDGGETWEPIDINDLFGGEGLGIKSYSQLLATPEGWVLIASGTLKDRPVVAGVERDVDDESMFTVTVEGYILTGQSPYGAAELRDPDGVLVRSWDHLEVANPVWSGLELIGGDVIVRTEAGDESITVTAEQWSALVDSPGSLVSDVLHSADGINWSILDTSTEMIRILATSAEGVVVQSFAIGNYSEVVPPVEFVPFPEPPAS